jgi:uncharacterized protein (TIGR00730 family)
MKLKSIVVFCGSKNGADSLYETHAKTLGKLLAENNIRLIYGGGNRGLMGAVANGVMEKGGTVTGIIPELLNQWEQKHDEITELIVVENMHVRKRLLYERAAAAIIMPGGFGTMDELFEILTWNQLSIHDKPIYILNTAGYYDALLQHMQHMYKEGFLYTSVEKAVTIITTPEELFS